VNFVSIFRSPLQKLTNKKVYGFSFLCGFFGLFLDVAFWGVFLVMLLFGVFFW